MLLLLLLLLQDVVTDESVQSQTRPKAVIKTNESVNDFRAESFELLEADWSKDSFYRKSSPLGINLGLDFAPR
jgi:hypothetical protein